MKQPESVVMKAEDVAKTTLAAKPKRRLQVHSVQVDYAGTTYHGTYAVESGILMVRSSFGSRSTQLGMTGSVNPAGLAKQILHELATQES